MAMLGTFLGYWFTVFFIEKQGRFMIQLLGFLFISVYMFVMAFHLDYLKEQDELFALLYGLTFFFANYGPNSTTFVLSAELFPTRMRSSCHALSAAAGKTGAIVGAFWVQNFTSNGDPVRIKKAITILAVTNMFGVFFTFFVTETMGMSLEEIFGEDECGNDTTQESATHSVSRAAAGTN